MMTLMTLITALVTMMITLMTRKGGGQAQRVNYSSPINGSHAGAGTLLPDHHYHPSLNDDEKYVDSISTTNQGCCQISNVKESMCFSTTSRQVWRSKVKYEVGSGFSWPWCWWCCNKNNYNDDDDHPTSCIRKCLDQKWNLKCTAASWVLCLITMTMAVTALLLLKR